MKRFALFMLIVCTALLAVGCTPKQVPLPDAQPKVEFFDSDSFDRQLSSSLKANFPEVTIVFPAAITLNSIPTRLDKWFSKVEEYGGDVKLVPVSSTGKGIVSEMLSLLVSAYEYIKDKVIYYPAKEYNAFVYYEENIGLVTEVVFERKPDADEGK